MRHWPIFVEQAVEEGRQASARPGVVYLVGAGPGDPELLTLRAARLLREADAIVHDSLITKEILALSRSDAERIYVGKRCNRHFVPQEEINRLLVTLATAGKRVVRLKGGDPFMFGRGGEEIEALAACGIPFEVVPGITAACGVAAYAGIPLTHRDYAQACVFATGHLKDGSVDLDWPALARPHQTVVIYMALGAMPEICRQLVRHGLSSATPAAAVQSATTPEQRVVTGTLGTLPDLVAAVGLASPTLLVVGEVVELHQRLAWFTPPAAGRPARGEARLAGPPAMDAEYLVRVQRHCT
ncbi:MAG TPA: uroporphyrinogen-III C-methyltransferase [Burkholderiales bacterium]|nr:uroporphyrinogen-III C-methyltransferase [Burkholderiales bacterium]